MLAGNGRAEPRRGFAAVEQAALREVCPGLLNDPNKLLAAAKTLRNCEDKRGGTILATSLTSRGSAAPGSHMRAGHNALVSDGRLHLFHAGHAAALSDAACRRVGHTNLPANAVRWLWRRVGEGGGGGDGNLAVLQLTPIRKFPKCESSTRFNKTQVLPKTQKPVRLLSYDYFSQPE